MTLGLQSFQTSGVGLPVDEQDLNVFAHTPETVERDNTRATFDKRIVAHTVVSFTKSARTLYVLRQYPDGFSYFTAVGYNYCLQQLGETGPSYPWYHDWFSRVTDRNGEGWLWPIYSGDHSLFHWYTGHTVGFQYSARYLLFHFESYGDLSHLQIIPDRADVPRATYYFDNPDRASRGWQQYAFIRYHPFATPLRTDPGDVNVITLGGTPPSVDTVVGFIIREMQEAGLQSVRNLRLDTGDDVRMGLWLSFQDVPDVPSGTNPLDFVRGVRTELLRRRNENIDLLPFWLMGWDEDVPVIETQYDPGPDLGLDFADSFDWRHRGGWFGPFIGVAKTLYQASLTEA